MSAINARRGDEPVATARHRLDKAGRVGRVAQRVAQSLHGGVQPVLEVDEGVVGPQALAELVASHELARPLEQHREQLQWLLLKAETCARLSQLARAQIELEDAKFDQPMAGLPRCRSSTRPVSGATVYDSSGHMTCCRIALKRCGFLGSDPRAISVTLPSLR